MMSEEDRAQLMKQRAERKAKQGDDGKKGLKDGKRELVPYEPDMATMLNYMTEQVCTWTLVVVVFLNHSFIL